MKTRRLFWKFFLAFWLAQMATGMAIGMMIWAFHPHGPGFQQGGEQRPPPPPPPLHHVPLPPLVAGSIVSLIFAWLLAGYFSRPIRTLREAFEAEAEGRLDTRVGAAMGRRNDELANLGQDFDRMAERLENVVNGQRRLLHDVSHELRSPLARLQAAAELLQQQPERAQEFIARIQRDTGRIDDLVGELLTLARLDAGMDSLPRESFDLGDLIEDLAEDVRFEAQARDCRLDLTLEKPLPVVGNIELLRRAFENVLRNAVRHTPAGSTVTVTGTRGQSGARVAVRDAGTGVAESDLEAIFEPFYRANNARPFEGYGLGLTIARQVMKLHGGSITAANVPTGGLAVTLNLPLTS